MEVSLYYILGKVNSSSIDCWARLFLLTHYSVGYSSFEKIAHGIHKTITNGQSLDVSDEDRI